MDEPRRKPRYDLVIGGIGPKRTTIFGFDVPLAFFGGLFRGAPPIFGWLWGVSLCVPLVCSRQKKSVHVGAAGIERVLLTPRLVTPIPVGSNAVAPTSS